MTTRIALAALAALFVTTAAQAADHRESPALYIGPSASSTSSDQSNGTNGGTVQTEIVSMDLRGTYLPPN